MCGSKSSLPCSLEQYRRRMPDERYPVNLGDPLELTVLGFAVEVRAMTVSKPEIELRELPEDHPKQRKPDISKARAALRWEPQVELEGGLPRQVEYFQGQAILPDTRSLGPFRMEVAGKSRSL
jgi:hypothetical protein